MKRIALVFAAVAMVVAFLPAAPAHADTRAPTGIHLEYQDATVALHHAFTMILHIDDRALATRPGAAISIRVGTSETTRLGFESAVDQNELGGVLYQLDPIPVAQLPPFGSGNVAVSLGLPGSNAAHTIGISRQGVYPLEVSLTNTGTATSPFITWIVVVNDAAQPVPEPLRVAWIWQLSAPPATLPNGTIDPAVAAQMRAGGRLDRIATLLGHNGRGPISLVITPETVEAWAKLAARDPALARSLALVRTAARRPSTELLPAPYVPIDIPALEAAGLGGELPREVVAGAKTLQDVLGTPYATGRAAFVDPADDATVDRLRTMLVTRVAVRDASLVNVPLTRTPAQAFAVDTSVNPPEEAVATAPFIERLLEGPAAPALKAQRVVASLAEAVFEAPSSARGVVIAPPANWVPDVEAMTDLMTALSRTRLVKTVTLEDLFSQISVDRESAGATRQLRDGPPPPLPVAASDYYAAAARLHAFEAVVGLDDTGERALLRALSTSITPERARAELASIEASVDAFTSAVTVDARRIQLTSARASIPLSFENRLNPPRDVPVVVHLESPKLVFPDGADRQVVLKPGTTTIRVAADGKPFSVEARTAGTFALTIRITSVDGSLEFGTPARVTVRSTVFGRLAAPITIAALVVLAFWWGNHFRRTRRARRINTAAAT